MQATDKQQYNQDIPSEVYPSTDGLFYRKKPNGPNRYLFLAFDSLKNAIRQDAMILEGWPTELYRKSSPPDKAPEDVQAFFRADTPPPLSESNGQLKAHLASDAARLKNTAFVGKPHKQLMNDLLQQVKKVDFRQQAKFEPDNGDAKLNVSDYHVLVSQKVLEVV